MRVRPQALRRTRLIAGAAASFSLAIGSVSLLGWVLDNRLLKTGFFGALTMKANTTVALSLTALSLLCLLPAERPRSRVLFARSASLLVLVLSGLTMSQHVFGLDLGVDGLLFTEPPGEAATASPGRMGPPACAIFLLLSSGLLLFDWRTPRGRAPMQWLAAASFPGAMLGVIGYATGATQLYGIARYTGIAAHTAFALLFLSIAVFLARAEHEPAAILVADNPGGDVARTMLPAAVVLPILVGWLRTRGEEAGLYDLAFGRALLLLSLIAFFTFLIWRLAHRLSAVANERSAAEEATGRARAEAERLASENVETLSVLESLLAHAPLGLVFFDRRRNCVRINDFAAKLADQPAGIGQDVHQIFPAVSPELERAIDQAFSSGVSTMNLELARGAPPRSWLTGVFPVRDARGKVPLAGAILIEISERKQLEAEKLALLDSERAARMDAERAAALKDQFLATLSHELRTPLNAILGWAAIARQTADRPTALDRPLETIERNARMQAQLIEDLLDISRIVSGKMRLELERVSLPGVVQAALNAVTPAAESKNIRINVELEPELGPIRADAARLQQVIWNLLANAVKFTPREGQIELSGRRCEGRIELSVKDSGLGIKAEFLPHVFDRFRQADSSTTRQHGGLGLGLSIVKQLVDLHQGTVRVTSDGENRGATFVVSLPLSAEGDPAALPEARRWELPDGALTGVHVLVVDDELDAREFVGRVLSDVKADVRLAGSVDEALSVLSQGETHVVVSDIGMPGKDGYDLLRALRQKPATERIPVIAVTAFARSEDRARALSAGFQLHFTKPVDPHELALAVARLAGRGGN